MINFTRAFELAWERMLVILFRPFDLGKWLAIGFSAFLAGLLAGGNGFNFSSKLPDPGRNWSYSYSSNVQNLNTQISHATTALLTGFSVLAGLFIAIFVLLFVLLIYWLGSRGQFLLLDNVVRNRGAISWPWQTYRRVADSLFGFYLLYLLIFFLACGVLAIPGIVAALPLFREHRWPEGGEIPVVLLLGLIYFVITVAASALLFLFRELGVPLMFRHGTLALPAFRQVCRLIQSRPGSILLFLLIRFGLEIAIAVVLFFTCCCFCCGVLPYLGTVILLPAIIYIKCFTLDFLAQFGPEYDVWIVDVAAPAAAPIITPSPAPEPPPPFSPPPPPV